MQIGFRCDATTEFGWGHFARCLTLADQVAELGASPIFFMHQPNAQIQQLLTRCDYQLVSLSSESQPIDSASLKLLVVDHYRLDATWWQPVRQQDTAIMVMNDQGISQPLADIIWDVAADKLESGAPEGQLTLLGPKFALLRKEFSELASTNQSQASPPSRDFRLMIGIGATDPENTGGLLLKWLNMQSNELPCSLAITLLSGSANPHLASLQHQFPEVQFEIDSSQVAKCMAEQDLIVTGPGNMMWEAFSLGVPCALIKTCNNQTRNLKLVETLMPDVYLGTEGQLDRERVVHTLLNLIKNNARRIELKARALQLCDGQGARRVARRLIEFIRERNDRSKPTAE